MQKTKWARNILLSLIIINAFIFGLGITSALYEDDEIEKIAAQLLNDLNRAYLEEDEERLKEIYDMDSQYGQWAYEYAVKKIEYIREWSAKQGINYTDISSDYTFSKVSGSDTVYNINGKAIEEYKYTYNNDPKGEKNHYSIAVYHYMRIEQKGDRWVISKDWFSDPMADKVAIDEETLPHIREYIENVSVEGYKLEGRRKEAVAYADKYSNASVGSSYNHDYRDYNPVGGDCANFTSQILYESGGFNKNSVWNYNKGGSMAWIKAHNLFQFMVNNGRGSRIAIGSYEEVYQSAYNLQPGDIIGYEEKGKIKHAATVTGYDSKGYPLINCHNVDRHRVPWDIGWNREGIKFWLVKVHY